MTEQEARDRGWRVRYYGGYYVERELPNGTIERKSKGYSHEDEAWRKMVILANAEEEGCRNWQYCWLEKEKMKKYWRFPRAYIVKIPDSYAVRDCMGYPLCLNCKRCLHPLYVLANRTRTAFFCSKECKVEREKEKKDAHTETETQ